MLGACPDLWRVGLELLVLAAVSKVLEGQPSCDRCYRVTCVIVECDVYLLDACRGLAIIRRCLAHTMLVYHLALADNV